MVGFKRTKEGKYALYKFREGYASSKFNMNLTSLNELNRVIYDILTGTTGSHDDLSRRAPHVAREDICINRIARASFRPNLFTIYSLIGATIVVVTDTHVTGHNPLGFIGRVAVLWDNSKVEVSTIGGHNLDIMLDALCHYFPPKITNSLRIHYFVLAMSDDYDISQGHH
ncbi:hypothetical protein Cgig2_020953 [Carnegiea gigantea]|uniref:Uncharacterized protein n=1 Tax=Carnegiea gigantea TaxID=171969 RepID=A0A9Q1JMZ5_9CARY|nr:hypothetical protein Cgig2_020953 [Carnegiea gigantea]